jgi:predicted metal-dependent phosphotriesterase family hydrolase
MVTVPTSAGDVDVADLGVVLMHEHVSDVDPVLPRWQYTYIHSGVLPGLRERGVPQDQIEQILMRNPRDFFAQQGTHATPGS